MSTALATVTVTGDQLELVRKTVASGATPDELKLYLYDCQRQGVHPLDKLLHFTKRGGKYTPVTSIDLMRVRASEADCLGISDAVFTGTPKGDDFAATVTVKRLVQGQVAEFSATARWTEYFPGESQGHMWKKMPHTMLGKCAEALALRKGFPKQLAGLYAREEMEQADSSPHPAAVSRPKPEPQDVPSGVDAQTGEVVDNDRPALPAGAVYIDRVEPGAGKVAGTLHLSDGRAVKVWLSESKGYDLAVQVCQEGVPVAIETKDSEQWGPSLKSLKRWALPVDAPEPAPITADDIHF